MRCSVRRAEIGAEPLFEQTPQSCASIRKFRGDQSTSAGEMTRSRLCRLSYKVKESWPMPTANDVKFRPALCSPRAQLAARVWLPGVMNEERSDDADWLAEPGP